ncbi:PD-(D/E)XK motif protein [Burkholderia sp. AU30198]|uniref:PD-(D/E)XK motif protein n=1 Tax=Burkholderia sp. AU30198 TaxID=2879627 RepID=UPI001CF49E11|nr:PD-(D/E)XK motif protein [Burkholderia sp. AU30198]MCA8299736.1 PD-(D/E)XK motif protein [Burkholderia sp. AU30198]
MTKYSATTIYSRHVTWSDLSRRISDEVPFIHRIPSTTPAAPSIDIIIAENGSELRMWLPCSPITSLSISPLNDVNISVAKKVGEHGIEISTRSRFLYQEIYNFFVSIIDKVHVDGVAPEIAVEETVERWRALLSSQLIMSTQVQLGLLGELWLLKRLASKFGESAVDAWTGPLREPHDFRIGNAEFEVKTTRGGTHTHLINGLNQLEPSGDRALYLLSIRVELAGAGAGTTLVDEIRSLKERLPISVQARFGHILREVYGYDTVHDSMYQTRLQMADAPRLIPILKDCPRLTRSMLSEIPLLDRIADVQYRANFEGLGFLEGSAEFDSLLSPNFIGTEPK